MAKGFMHAIVAPENAWNCTEARFGVRPGRTGKVLGWLAERSEEFKLERVLVHESGLSKGAFAHRGGV